MRTTRQIRGRLAEDHAAEYLEARGWRILARNLQVGRDEIDVLAVDPGPPASLVAVEVRSLRTPSFGAPEEGVDGRKVAHLYRGLARACATELIDQDHRRLLRRVDLLVIDRRTGVTQVRHLRSLEPP